ncbi:hypothetical protein CYMTET_44579 [Cymbomonas tetramitiformis]|uniref:Uncharacterized protein n=1 Tax=Cymbomonas tetramitiformis TaxID=36881 RepID=A0AAE0EYW9_9CHLO|nr:hypothetical protein CYMTET_44579 [Cymbomonas tetramitiformis]
MADVHARPPKLRSVSTCPPPAAMCAGVRASLPACNTCAPARQSSANASRSSRAASMGVRPPRQCGGAAAEVARPGCQVKVIAKGVWPPGMSGSRFSVAAAEERHQQSRSHGRVVAVAVRQQRQGSSWGSSAGWQGGSGGGVAARGAKVAVAVKQQMRCGSRGGMAAGAVRPQRQRAPKFGGSQGGAVALAAASSEEEISPEDGCALVEPLKTWRLRSPLVLKVKGVEGGDGGQGEWRREGGKGCGGGRGGGVEMASRLLPRRGGKAAMAQRKWGGGGEPEVGGRGKQAQGRRKDNLAARGGGAASMRLPWLQGRRAGEGSR